MIVPNDQIVYTNPRGVVYFGTALSGVYVGDNPKIHVQIRVAIKDQVVAREFIVPARDVDEFPAVQTGVR